MAATDPAAQAPLRVLVVDDDPLARFALRTIIGAMHGVVLAGEVSGAEEAVRQAEELSPDVVLMDVHMSGMDGFTATRGLVQRCPGVRVLVVSVFPEEPYALEALKAGATGYLRKESVTTHLHEAIVTIGRGDTYLSPPVAPRLLRRILQPEIQPTGPALTGREREVLRLLVEGHSNKEIAAALDSTIRTVKAHVSRILRKLNVEDRTQAAIMAVRLGLTGEGSAPRPHAPKAR